MRFVAVFLSVFFLAQAIPAATIHVPADQPTIQAGIDAAANGDTVLVGAGIYTGAGNVNVDPAGKVVIVRSETGFEGTVIDCQLSARAFFIHSGENTDMVIEGFSILNGNTSPGGGISIANSSPTVINCYFEGCIRGYEGSALYAEGNSSPVVRGNVFNYNQAPSINITTDQEGTIFDHNLIVNESGGNCAIVIRTPMSYIYNNTVDNIECGAYALNCENCDDDFRNNIVTNCAGYVVSEVHTCDYNDFWNNGGASNPGPNGISADPQYLYTAGLVYGLQMLSPCIDAGDPDPQYNDPDGTRNDMGAFPHLHGDQPLAVYVNLGSESAAHVVNHTPIFYWTVLDSVGTQEAFEIEVGTDTDWTIVEMWSTGTEQAVDTSAIYGGNPLMDGAQYYLRIRLYNGINWGSWNAMSFRMNSVPVPPLSYYPIGQSLVYFESVRLAVQNASDAEGDALTYDFEVFSDPSLTFLEYSEYGVAEANVITYSNYITGLYGGNQYWWRANAKDGFEYSDWCASESFITREAGATIHVPVDQPTIQAGIDAAANGDTVLVAPGTYTENITYAGKAIKVIGVEGATVTTLRPADAGTVNIQFIAGESAYAELRGFTVQGGTNNQVVIDNDANPVISHNIFIQYTGGDCNIRVRVANALIKYNLFYGNGGQSCIGTYQGSFTALNNTMDRNARGLHSLSPVGSVVKNNIVTNSTAYGILGTFAELDYNDAWQNGSDNNPGPHGISNDPIYMNPVTNDYTLNVNSPCIDAGDPDPQYNDPDGSRNDMGAFPLWTGDLPPILDPIGPKAVSEADTLIFAVTASDPDGVIVSLTADPVPDGASFVDSGGGRAAFSWIPDYTQAGTYPVTFTATDDSGATDFEIVTITVTNTNRPPVWEAIGDKEVFAGFHLEFVVAAVDPDNTPLTLSATNVPNNGQFIDSANGHGLFQFDPDYSQAGAYPVTFVASDGDRADTELVTITVNEANLDIRALFIDGLSTPTNVVDNTPLIEWTYDDPTGSHPQTKFEIAVSIDDDWQYAEMWNPAPFIRAETFIVYAGVPLIDGETYYARLRVHNGLAWSEWYEISFRMNSVPGVPEALSPVEGQVVGSVTPELYIQNSSDAEGDALTYDFILYADTSFVLTLGEGIAQQPDSTGWIVDVALEENRKFLWAARANDGYELSAWSPLDSFWVNAAEESPPAFDLIYPPDTGWLQVYEFPTEFRWSQSADPDPFDSVFYRLKIAVDSNFVFVATYDSIFQTAYDVPSLNYSTHYWWKVYAIDTEGNMTQSNNVADFMTWVLGDANADLGVNIADAVFLINYIFKGGYAPWPLKVGDVNGDCAVNLADAVYLINYVFKGGDPPGVGCVPEPVKAEGSSAKTSE